jgi:predicted dehydrogenase
MSNQTKKIADNQVRWGILGVGNVCEVKSAPAMQLVHQSKIVAVMRRNGEKAKDYADRHRVPKWYDDAQKLIDDHEVNAIYIATPPNAHLELCTLAAKAGKPIYVEKPMARTSSECQQMIEICAEHQVPLYVAYYRRRLPHFLKIKELIDLGEIGSIRSVQIDLKQALKPGLVAGSEENWRIDPEIAGGGYFFDLASHQLDLLDFLFGAIEKVTGYSSNQAKAYEAEDIVVGSFVFENGVLGSGNWCFTSAEGAAIDQIAIFGSTGKISFETFGRGEFILEVDGKKAEKFNFELPKHIQQPLIETIVGDLLGKGSCPSMGVSAARTNWVMDELTKNRIA